MAQETKNNVAEDRNRAIQIILYDLQGGPFPDKAFQRLEREVQKIAESFDGLAITVIRE